MKKTKILFIVSCLLLIASFYLFVQTTFAQTTESLFNISSVVTQKITAATNGAAEPVTISPFTTVIIPPASFPGEVTMRVYSGNWDKVKSILPKDQSPIDSFYFVFEDSNNKTVRPTVPIIIQTVNNYIGTDTFFYPLSNLSRIDTAKEQKRIGHVAITISLPAGDSGFISAANINLKQDDSSLNPVFINTTPKAVPSKTTNSLFTTLLTIGIIILAVVAIIALLIINKKRKK